MIEEIKEVPCLPQVSMELIRQAFSDEPDIKALASIVEKDPNLSAKLFKTVNSAAFGPKVEIKNINQAISLMGLEMLRSTVVSLALGQYFINNFTGNALDVKNFCVHSLATAVVVRKMSKALDIQEADQLYLLGLLHDLGQIVMDSLPIAQYRDVLKHYHEGKSLEEAEWEVFGFNNRQVWQLLARTWGFPNEIIELFKGSLKGKITLLTRKLVEDCSRVADTLGYFFIQPFTRGAAPETRILTAIDQQTLLAISISVQNQMQVMGNVLSLPLPDESQIKDVLLSSTHQMAATNAQLVKVRRELSVRVEWLDRLIRLSEFISGTPDKECLASALPKELLKAFQVTGAFLLVSDGKGDLAGYAATRGDEDKVEMEQLFMKEDSLSPSMQRSIQSRTAVEVSQPTNDEAVLKKCLGDVNLAWIAPACARERFMGLLCLGLEEKTRSKLHSDAFGKILEVLGREIGLFLENARLARRAAAQPVQAG